MKLSKRLVSLFLSACVLCSALAIGSFGASATDYDYSANPELAQETIRGGAVLHCFCWSYNTIKAKLPEIYAAGYTAVQTSPVQPPRDYGLSYTDMSGQWWKLYQPLGFRVSDGSSWLGTKDELTSLCETADNYGIKVIVDIVANHMANNGNEGGTYSYLNQYVDSDMKNSDFYHTSNKKTNDNSRYTMTQYHLGMPDLNTQNSIVQNKALALLEECVDCGVDGFRFDTAKHIELPSDPSNCKGDFWPNVIDGVNTYCEDNDKPQPFIYGEILGYAGTEISNYTKFMAVTDSVTGDHALDKAYWNVADQMVSGIQNDESNGGNGKSGLTSSDSVLWVESHDTYMGNSSSGYFYNQDSDYDHHTTKYVDDSIITRAWAIIGSRAGSTSLFFARPNNTMGAASTDTTWKSTEVAEVNKFKNVFDGQSESLGSSGSNIAYNIRGTKGIVISKFDGGGNVSLTVHKMKNGTYTDHVSNTSFTVSNGTLTGTVGNSGVAVIYNTGDTEEDCITARTLYLAIDRNSWKVGNERYAMYLFNSSGNTWVSMADSDGDGIYEAAVPTGRWTGVIFCRMDGASTENSWSNKWNQTVDLFPTDSNDCFTVSVKDTDDDTKYNGVWSVFAPHTHTYGQPVWTWSNNNGSAYAVFTCSQCHEQKTVVADVNQQDNGDNTVTYTATVTFNNQLYTKTITETKPAEFSGKLYLKPNAWEEDDARFAIYLFNNLGQSVWADMTYKEGDGVYEATIPEGVWHNVIFVRMNPAYEENSWNQSSSDDRVWNQTEDLSPVEGKNNYRITETDLSVPKSSGQWDNNYIYITRLAGHSISLDGDIALNFYFELDQSVVESETSYLKMSLTDTDGSQINPVEVYVSNAETETLDGKTYYKFKYNVAAKNMDSPIQAELIDNGNTLGYYEYSVRDYAQYLIDHADDREEYEAAKDLVESMMLYGDWAAYYFGVSESQPPIPEGLEGLPENYLSDMYSCLYSSNLDEAVTFVGTTLSLKTETTFSLYFKSSGALSFSCFKDFTEIYNTETASSGDMTVFRIRGIKPNELDDAFEIICGEHGTITYSPMCYIVAVLTRDGNDENLRQLMKSLYLYYKSAANYFG